MPIDPSIHSRRNPNAATIQYHVNRINNALVEYENAARTLNHTISSDIHNYSSRERNLIINEQTDIAASRLGDYLYEYTWRGSNEMQENAREFGMISFRRQSQQNRLPNFEIADNCDFIKKYKKDEIYKHKYNDFIEKESDICILNIPKLEYKNGSETNWKQNMNCTICNNEKYNPIFNKGFRALCKECLISNFDKVKGYKKQTYDFIDDSD